MQKPQDYEAYIETLTERLETVETENSALRQQLEGVKPKIEAYDENVRHLDRANTEVVTLTEEVERLQPFEQNTAYVLKVLRSEAIRIREMSPSGISQESRERIMRLTDPKILVDFIKDDLGQIEAEMKRANNVKDEPKPLTAEQEVDLHTRLGSY